MAKPKWTREQIMCLIDAYKQEPCLYAIGNANYHNKHLRTAALYRVCDAVRELRPGTEHKECQTKFNNLRTQFNLENSKIKKSMKSGAGTTDIYQPSLWYFNAMRFVEDHFVPRKSIMSPLPNAQERPPSPGGSIAGLSELYTEYEEMEVMVGYDGLPSQENGEEISHQDTETQRTCEGTTSSSGDSSETPCSSKRKRKHKDDDSPYVEALRSLTDCLKEPVPTKTDSVDAAMAFIGSILKYIRSEQLRLDVLSNLVQTTLNAKSEEARQDNL